MFNIFRVKEPSIVITEEMDKELEELSSKTNRHPAQTRVLFQLVKGDIDKLKAFEVNAKNLFLWYCPDTLEEIENVIKTKPKSNWFSL